MKSVTPWDIRPKRPGEDLDAVFHMISEEVAEEGRESPKDVKELVAVRGLARRTAGMGVH